MRVACLLLARIHDHVDMWASVIASSPNNMRRNPHYLISSHARAQAYLVSGVSECATPGTADSESESVVCTSDTGSSEDKRSEPSDDKSRSGVSSDSESNELKSCGGGSSDVEVLRTALSEDSQLSDVEPSDAMGLSEDESKDTAGRMESMEWLPSANCGPYFRCRTAPLTAQAQVFLANSYINLRRLTKATLKNILREPCVHGRHEHVVE